MPLCATLDSVTGRLSNFGDRTLGVGDVPLSAPATGVGPWWIYDPNNQLALPINSRTPRSLFAIRADLVALNATQKGNINTDLFGGSPAKWTQDIGPNAGALYALFELTQVSTLTAADVTSVKIAATALYTQDHPFYLVTPTFDPTINVPGDTAS